jgi:hypothetical protein
MRTSPGVLLLAFCLASCATPAPLPPSLFVIDGIPVYGRAHEISKSQIRAAIAEDRRWPSHPENKIYSIEVAAPTELHIFHTTRNTRLQEYTLYIRVRGKWQTNERVLSGSALLVPTD